MPFFKPDNYYAPRRSRVLENATKRNGLRHTIFNTVGDKYVGEWKDDKKTGKGIIWTRNGELYEGDVQNNNRHGFGVLAQRIPNTDVYGLCYRGNWKNGRMHGEGLRVYPDGSFYFGEFKFGKKNGHGQQWYPNGGFFDGYFKDDLREGLGLFIREDGNRYEGEWKHDLKHGKGLFFHLNNGQLQEGVWKNNICVYSKIRDIDFRQCAIDPTACPLPNITLKYTDKVCAIAEQGAILGFPHPCDNAFVVPDFSTDSEVFLGSYVNKIDESLQ